MSALTYKPPPTVERFMMSPARIRVLVGPLGSGKSMGCIMEILKKSCEQQPYNGVRYTRWACIRNTLQQLRQTVLSDIQQYLGPIVSYYATDSTVRLRVGLPDGTKVHADLLMLPLDTKEDVRRLLSLQLTGGWINELREVNSDIIRPLLGRTGRYPSKAHGGATWRGIICDTNPWDTDSPYHERMVLKPHPSWALFHQPSGICPQAENVENLPVGYYEDLMDDASSEFVAVHVESQWGSSNAGQAVFRSSFHAPDHAIDMNVVINPHRPLIIGMDFGRTPTALIGQVDMHGRILVFREVTSEDMGLHQFLDEKLRPVLMEGPFAGRRVFVVADPAGIEKSQLSEETPFSVLRDHGFLAYPASTNDPQRRIMAVEKALRSHIVGQPGLQINRSSCQTLVHALGNKYRYRKRKDGQLEDRPEKLHPWSDVADSLQYLCLGAQSGIVGRVMRRDIGRAPGPLKSAAGWT
jgi:hypothetical protein